jgi:hypothetical protein
VSPVQVKLGQLAARALSASADPDPSRLELLMPRAVSFYLAERDGGRSEWSYPSFLDGGDGLTGAQELRLDQELWDELQAEAARQGVDPGALLQHAAFYYGAARDDGRLTERIAAELRREEGGKGAG